MSPSPETEALFTSVREALAPTEADRERNLAALAAKLGADAMGVVVGATIVTGAKSLAVKAGALGQPGAVSSWSVFALKVVPIAIAIAAIPAVAMFMRASSSRTSNGTPISHVATGSPTVVASSETLSTKEPEPAADAPDETARGEMPADEAPKAVDKARSTTAKRRTPETGAPSSTARRPSTSSAFTKAPAPADEGARGDTSAGRALHDEIELVERIHGAQRAGDAATVHALVAEHARRFPRGTLGEECAAADTMAYCSTDTPDAARARADKFQRRYASSPLASRVRKTCQK